MISVSDALDNLFSLVCPTGEEQVSLYDAAGRTLSRPVIATRSQPPFASSAMDGYAIKDPEVGATYAVVGEAAAGARYGAALNTGEAVRIFTGAPVPEGTTRVIMQEDTARDGDNVTVTEISGRRNIRPAGDDFAAGDEVDAPRLLGPGDIALLAAMNQPKLWVRKRPVVALLSTGDELVMPGEDPNEDQIIASNAFGLKALLEQSGAEVRMLPIARDNEAALTTGFELAEGADLIVTIGGASVGDHDLVAPVAAKLGMKTSFYKVAMRPGKPLMAGKMDKMAMIGLPGNPVSALVCGHVFLRPVIRAMLGNPPAPLERQTAPLAAPMAANGIREHYMRARLEGGQLTPHVRQDSALLSVLSASNALIVRPPNVPEAEVGDSVDYIPIPSGLPMG